MTIPRFGFSVFLALYAALLFLEYLRPGFVSTAMNVHGILLIAAGFVAADIVMTRRRIDPVPDRSSSLPHRFVKNVGSLIVAVILALVMWSIGPIFGDFRLLFSFVIGVLTLIVFRSNHSS